LVKSSQVSIDNDEVERLKEECKSLKERLETTQQQNLKLKAKLKSVLNSNKGEKSSKEQESEKVLKILIEYN
jgi:predicted RNase H-like nuclease (RuvC/YqgF family)